MSWTRTFPEYMEVQEIIDKHKNQFKNTTFYLFNIKRQEYATIQRDCKSAEYIDVMSESAKTRQIRIKGNIPKLASEMNEIAYRDNSKQYGKACDVLVTEMENESIKKYNVIKQDF